jgi:hypothetical protein
VPGCLTSGRPVSPRIAVEDPLYCSDRDGDYQERYSSATRLWDSGRRDEAVHELEAALQLNSGSAQGWLALGRMYGVRSMEAGAAPQAEVDPFLQKAVAALKEAIALDPHCVDAYRALAELYGGRDARLAVAVFEAAAESDPAEYGGELERAQAAAAASTYALARLNVFTLSSAHETLQPGILDTEFHFDPCRLASVVIHTCISGNNRQSAHGWLFESAEPDLDRDRPVAEIAISSSGDVSVRPGCPADYDTLRERLATAEMMSSPLAAGTLRVTNTVPAGVRLGESANDAEAIGENLDARTPPSREARAKRLRVVMVAAGLLMFLGGTLAYLDHKLSVDHGNDRTAVASAISGTGVPNTGAGSAASIVSVPSKAPPSPPEMARRPLDGSDVTEPHTRGSLNEPRRSASHPVPQASRRHTSTVPIPSRPRQNVAATVPSTQSPRPVSAQGASVASPAIIEEPRRVPREQLALNTGGMERLKKEQQEQCTYTSFIPREICKERLRWSHCHPDKWDQVPECRVHRSDFAR